MDYIQLVNKLPLNDWNIITIFVSITFILVFLTIVVYYGGRLNRKFFYVLSPLCVLCIYLISANVYGAPIFNAYNANEQAISSAYDMTLKGHGKIVSLGSYKAEYFDNDPDPDAIPSYKADDIKLSYQGTYTATLKNDEGKSIRMKITIDKGKRMKVFTADNTNGEPSWELIEPNVTTTAGKE
jgi:hypothetical protein